MTRVSTDRDNGCPKCGHDDCRVAAERANPRHSQSLANAQILCGMRAYARLREAALARGERWP